MLRRARRVRKHGFRRYKGDAEEICRRIIEDCYDHEHKYLRVSAGHFCEYYVRDFAFCCEALVKLGFSAQVRSTLEYALKRFRHAGITTAIDPDGVPFDYYLPSGPESIGLFLYSIRVTGNEDLARHEHAFLQRQVDRVKGMMDHHTLLPKGQYSTIRDQTRRRSSCYDMVMLAVVAREAGLLGLRFPHSEEDIRKRLIEEYWNGTYFFQDITKQPIIVGDANVFPFWTGVVDDKAMLDEAMTAVQTAGLDTPLPLRYVSATDKKRERTGFHFSALLAPDYETDSIWAHLGLAYVRVLTMHDPARARKHIEKYRKEIEQHRNFLEVYDSFGQPLRGQLYVTDESMLWCANWLALNKFSGLPS